MKHIRLFDKKDSLMQDVTTNPSADYPVIALCKNEDELSFWNTPIIKAKYNITSDNDVKSCIQSDYNIKSLTIDGELKFKKNTWVKYEYQLTQNDFQDENNIVKKIYVKLNSGCRNVYLKSNEKATQFLLIYPQGNINNINQKFLNIEETKESLFIKQIDEYTYDLTNFYLYYDKTIHNAQINLVGIFLADSEGNVLTQNLKFECFDVRNEQIEHSVTKDNAFNKDIFFCGMFDISVDTNVNINVDDYLYICGILGGKMQEIGTILISETIKLGFSSISNNILHIDLSRIFGSESGGFCVIIDKSYGNNEDLVKFVKNCTITGKKYFTYTPILSVGEHDIEVELLQQLYTPFFETNALVDLDMSHVNGKYIHINNICNKANKLKQVRLPNNINSIGTYAFKGCLSLTSIVIPDSVTSIGSHAFNNCFSLTSVTITDSVTTIGNYAFDGCQSLTSVTIPDSVTSISDHAFENCESLTSVTIPNSVTTIGDGAFRNCHFQRGKLITPNNLTSVDNWGAKIYDVIQDDGLCINGTTAVKCRPKATSVTIGSVVKTIGDGAFQNCTDLTSVTIGNNVTSIGSSAFNGCFSLTQVNIPDSVTTICERVFNGCGSLTSVTIPNSVTSIGDNSFYYCTSLTSVTIPSSVTSIGSYAFYYCRSLTSVTIGSGVTSIGSSAFTSCTSLTSVTIPSGVTSISSYAFSNCSGLTSVTIPNSVTSIDEGAFARCTSLTSVTIPNMVTTIGVQAFLGCTSLTSVTIPNRVTTIDSGAFYSCGGLTSVTIGSGVRRIYDVSFYGCESLTSVTCYATTAPTLGGNIFYRLPTNGTLHVPNGSDYSSWLRELPSGWTIAYI